MIGNELSLIVNNGFLKQEYMNYNHESEYIVENIINYRTVYEGILIRREEDNYAPDLNVYVYDFLNLRVLYELCKIEVEQKPQDEMLEYPNPPKRWPYWSFLGRKIENETFADEDVYLLCNPRPHNKIFWTTFGDIRYSGYERLVLCNSKKEIDYRKEIGTDENIKPGYESLREYLIKLKTNKEW